VGLCERERERRTGGGDRGRDERESGGGAPTTKVEPGRRRALSTYSGARVSTSGKDEEHAVNCAARASVSCSGMQPLSGFSTDSSNAGCLSGWSAAAAASNSRWPCHRPTPAHGEARVQLGAHPAAPRGCVSVSPVHQYTSEGITRAHRVYGVEGAWQQQASACEPPQHCPARAQLHHAHVSGVQRLQRVLPLLLLHPRPSCSVGSVGRRTAYTLLAEGAGGAALVKDTSGAPRSTKAACVCECECTVWYHQYWGRGEV
jgi:hypothetical protein